MVRWKLEIELLLFLAYLLLSFMILISRKKKRLSIYVFTATVYLFQRLQMGISISGISSQSLYHCSWWQMTRILLEPVAVMHIFKLKILLTYIFKIIKYEIQFEDTYHLLSKKKIFNIFGGEYYLTSLMEMLLLYQNLLSLSSCNVIFQEVNNRYFFQMSLCCSLWNTLHYSKFK